MYYIITIFIFLAMYKLARLHGNTVPPELVEKYSLLSVMSTVEYNCVDNPLEPKTIT
jgi:hypothetical protein